MPKDSPSEGFFENLQPLNNYFDESLLEDDSISLIEQELLDVQDRYDDGQGIAKGGMKSILSSTDKITLREVAKAKLLDLKPENRERFINEARLTASLEHPNIIPIYDLGVDEEPFFTMKKIDGENLFGYVKSLSQNAENHSFADLMQIFLKICDAVAFAHDKGIVHLDLKPSNICLGKFGEVIVCDWGLAKILCDEETHASSSSLDPDIFNDATLDGVVKGSPGYLAPEQISSDSGTKDEQTDIYALGGILYNLLTLKAPIETGNLEACFKDTLEGKIIAPLKWNNRIPQSLAAVAMKALSVEKCDRYRSVIELRSEINRWLGGFATEAEGAGFIKSVWFLVKRHKTVCGLLAIMLILTGTLGALVILKESRALDARELYLEEKENARLAGLKDIPHLVLLTQQAIREVHLDTALTYISQAVEKDIGNKELWSIKGKVHFMLQQFNLAEDALVHAQETPRALWIKPLSEEFGAKKTDDQLLDLESFKDIISRVQHIQYAYLMCDHAVKRSKNLKYALAIAMMAVKKPFENRKIKDWDFDHHIEGNKLSLDFSRMRILRTLRGLRFLPVTKLNIAGTRINKSEELEMLPLVEINIAGSQIINPWPLLKIKTLKKLIIAEGQFPHLSLPKHKVVKISYPLWPESRK